jgi:Protein of unknown function (Hypoth_ymh)
MMLRVLEGIRKFQEHLLELGLARAVLALPAPRMLALPSPTAEGAGPASVFARVVTEAEIQKVSRDLFMSGHYSLAVQEAYKAVDKYVKEKAGPLSLTGTKLMELAFSPTPQFSIGQRCRHRQSSTSRKATIDFIQARCWGFATQSRMSSIGLMILNERSS